MVKKKLHCLNYGHEYYYNKYADYFFCKKCGKTHKIEVDPVGFKKFEEGTTLIQDALPGLTTGQREMLLSQICEEYFDKMFEDEDNAKFLTK